LKTAAWYPYDKIHTNQVSRCKSKAKPDSIFCGTHKWLSNLIETIVWKEDLEQ